MPLSCRFYEHRLPDVEDVVMVNVQAIAQMSAYVQLLEYNNAEGMILLSELSRRRIRSINKLIRVGRSECVVVIRVDKEKSYIDLSKRRVSPDEIVKCEEKYAKARAVNSILRHVGELLEYESDEQLEELYRKTAWFFDRKQGRPGACYEMFKLAVNQPEVLDDCDIDARTKEVLLVNIKRRLTPQAVKLRADIEVACYEYEGIDAVKNALRKGIEVSTEEAVVKICLIAPPLYVMTTQTTERADGLEVLNNAIKAIEASIKQSGGVFTIQMAPKVVSDTDEHELAQQMEKAEEENRELSGDEDYSDDEEGSGSGGD